MSYLIYSIRKRYGGRSRKELEFDLGWRSRGGLGVALRCLFPLKALEMEYYFLNSWTCDMLTPRVLVFE